ncbi:MAG: DUF4258 domain-containing protein [Candidatus Omnitrophica bacterium]|nr:DUF4258 domain-containing protein [Candidatus Omnitrophota bacterium]
MKPIIFSPHALDQLKDRGTTEEEVKRAIQEGERAPAKEKRIAFRKNFLFDSKWKGKHYQMKQVMPIVVEEDGNRIVVTVYVFYFGGEAHED